MALNVTENLKETIKLPKVTPTLVLKIDGVPEVFGNISIKKYIKIGDPDLLIGNDWLVGGFNLVENQSPYISFNTGTTTRISQKLDPSRGLGSSVSQMAVTLLDRNEEMTELIAPGFRVDDMLGRFATVFLGLENTSWPEDYNVVFRGVVESIDGASGVVTLYLNSTEDKKRAGCFGRATSETSTDLNYRSITSQAIRYTNRPDITNSITVSFIGGATAGNEIVTLPTPTSIQVQIEDGVSIASQVKEAIEAHPGASQLVELFVVSDIAQNIGSASLSTSTSVDLADTDFFISPADVLQTFIKVGEELIRYTNKTGLTLSGLTRGQLNSTPALHLAGADIEQVLRLTGNGIDLALKLMLSQGPEFYVEDVPIASFYERDPSTQLEGSVWFEGVDLETEYGVAIGDEFTSTGDAVGANNLTSIIVEIGRIDDGSYIVLADPTVASLASSAVAKFKSPFNTLPIGLGMLPREVDVAQHLYVRDTFLATVELDLYVKQISNTKDFLEREIYLPMTCYSIPRKGRASVAYHVGPIANSEIVFLDLTTVENPQALAVRRSLSENFFNRVAFNYDYNPVTELYAKTANFESDKKGLIPVGDRPFILNSVGLRTSSSGDVTAESSARRYLQRYERGAEFIRGVKVQFRAGYKIEIDDIVAVDFADLKLTDSKTGTRSGALKLMSVLNKTIDNKTGEITLDVINTVFELSDRYGTIAPASLTATGSTTTKLKVKKSFGTKSFERESYKWASYIGQNVQVRTADFATVYTTILRGFDAGVPFQALQVDAIPAPPGEDWIIEPVQYPTGTDPNDEFTWKSQHCFWSPQVAVTNAVSLGQLIFEVALGDIGKFSVGASVRVHSEDYTDDAPEALVTVVDTILNRVTIDTAAGFNIDDAHFVDLIGFADGQGAYRWV